MTARTHISVELTTVAPPGPAAAPSAAAPSAVGAPAAPVPDPVGAAFLHDLADLLRAGDPYGRLDRFADEHLLRPYVVEPAARAAIAVDCDVEPITLERLRSFYQAVAAGVERGSGVMTAVLVDISHEGFGRAVVVAGRLLLLADPLRDVQRFGYADLGALAAAGAARIARGLAALVEYPEVARADL